MEQVSPPPVSPWRPRVGLGTLCVLRPQSFGALATGRHPRNRRMELVILGAR